MTFSRRWALAAGAAAVVVIWSCTDSFQSGGPVAAPDSVTAVALGIHSIELTWSPSADASGYIIERRAKLSGAFATVRTFSSGFVNRFVDDSLDPETIYGYRVVTVALTGQRSEPSLVAGARTAPVPGIVATVSTAPPELADPAGYTVTIAGDGDTLQAPVGPLDQHRFSPLASGVYHVTLEGVPANCSVAGGPEQMDTVTDQGLQTLRYSAFNVSCRDARVGRLTVSVTTTGDSLDGNGYTLTLSGVAADSTLPDSARAYFRRDSVGVQALRQFEGLLPGTYTLDLADVAGNCTVQGATTFDLDVHALDDLSKSFAVVCHGTEDPNRPLVWRNLWSTSSAPAGARVRLAIGLDLSRKPGQDVAAVQATLGYDPTVVRLDSVVRVAPWQVTANTGTPGVVTWLAFVTGAGLTDSTTFANFYFTVIGSAGAATTTQTSIDAASDGGEHDITTLIRRAEGTFTIATGGSIDQPPVARPGGSYSGTIGVPISFSGSASSDPDGTITTYAWSFGDGATGSGVTVSHSYASSGSYTVTLTVTDNGGVTGSSQTTASVGTGGSNQPPQAVMNGPYNGTAGSAVAFSAAGSLDADGSIASYAWTFGDGASGTGVTPSHIYGASGTYTVTLTVSDDQGATGSANTTATIAPGSGQPFTWRNDFGSIGADSLVSLTITLDLSSDIPQTPVAEALQSWQVDSMKWDPTVLRYFSFNFGTGGAGSVNPTDALTKGKLIFSGVQSAANSTGLITIARIQFKVIGAHGRSTTTASALGTLLGTPATGSFSYGSYTAVSEGTLQVP